MTVRAPPRWRREVEELEQEKPGLYEAFLRYARRARAAGHDSFCARRLLDDARAESGMRVGNAAGPLLARLVLERHPAEFKGWIKIKRGGVDEPDVEAGDDRPVLPTGHGKTACLRLARIHAAWEAARPLEREAFLTWVVARHDAEVAETGRTTLL